MKSVVYKRLSLVATILLFVGVAMTQFQPIKLFDSMQLDCESRFKREPYDLTMGIELKEERIILIIDVTLNPPSWFISPRDDGNYKGQFTLMIGDKNLSNLNVIEDPKSIIGIEPFDKKPIFMVREDTRYKYDITDYTGFMDIENCKIQFVIEPQCTLEQIDFQLIKNRGDISIRQVGC